MEELEKPDSPATQPQLHASIDDFHYDQKCGLLSVQVWFENSGKDSVHLVCEDFSFVRGLPAPHKLSVRNSEDQLLIDLSHQYPTDEGLHAFRSEGLLGYAPGDTLELPPGNKRYITYTFQFPLLIDPKMSETERIRKPEGKRRLRLRFGYSKERGEAFRLREFQSKYELEDWQNRIVKDWQSRIDTDDVEIEF